MMGYFQEDLILNTITYNVMEHHQTSFAMKWEKRNMQNSEPT